MSKIKRHLEALYTLLRDNGIDCETASVGEIEAGVALFTNILTAQEISETAKALHAYFNLDA